MQAQAAKPPLYRGFPLPIHDLSPNAFEDFTYQALSLLGKKLDFQMTSGPQPSGDQGYDCTAKSTLTNHLICIQCKRYDAALSISDVAEEIIKVSLDKALNNSDTKHQYIITSGEVNGPLRKAYRQANYTSLKSECEKIINKGKFQPALLKEAKILGVDPIQIANEYLDTLENLTIWSGRDFQNELITIWSELSDILEQNFLIEKILKDNPTPDFNLKAYLNRISLAGDNLTALAYSPAPFPPNLNSEYKPADLKQQIITTDNILEILKAGNNIAISSPGGSGKSCTLSIITKKLALESDIHYLPVNLKLRSYSRNMLNHMIEQELGILFGSWKSLPFKFLFLLDGLDEMLQCDTQAFFDDLSGTIDDHSYIVTLRDQGLSIDTQSNKLACCLSIQPLSYRSAFNIASSLFKNEELAEFYDQYRSRLSSVDFDFFSSPFVLSRSIGYYKNNKKLPDSTEDILEDWISSKLKKDKTRVVSSDIKSNKLPEAQVIHAFATVLYKATFGLGVSSIPEDSYNNLMIECYDELISSQSYLARILSFEDFINLITGYEILYKGKDDHFSTPHQIISDYLASKALSKNWRMHQSSVFNHSHYDIWLYCSNSILENEKDDFIDTVLGFDILLAAKIARRFQGGHLTKVEKKLLELESSEKVLTRSLAISALGILATKSSYERLKSRSGEVDFHHFHQRQKALALGGDLETLIDILVENEPRAQSPAKISGGSYDLWFLSPPTVITNIARRRINEWKVDGKTELCLSLRTLALFGDSSDCEALVSVLEQTNYMGEFYDATRALLEIDRSLAHEVLVRISNINSVAAFWAKQVLSSLGIEFDITQEFDYLIELSYEDEDHLIQEGVFHTILKIVELIKTSKLDSEKIETLISTYQRLNFRKDLYFYGLIWSLGLSGGAGCLLPLVRLAYSRKDPDEINYAIGYLSKATDADIDADLTTQIDEYFNALNGQHEGIFRLYVNYYYNKDKEFALDLMRNKLTDHLKDLSPDSLSIENYNFGNICKYDLIFDFLSLCNDGEVCLTKEDSYKLLLINTDHSDPSFKLAKLKVLNGLNKEDLDTYLSKVRDKGVRACIASYMLNYDLSNTTLLLAEEYFPVFFSHQFYYPAIISVCTRHWDDSLAKLFLTSFCEFNWHPFLAQIFEQNTSLFLKLFTSSQLEEFEASRKGPVNVFVERTYRIFLESKSIDMK